jgi:hypothetical protein
MLRNGALNAGKSTRQFGAVESIPRNNSGGHIPLRPVVAHFSDDVLFLLNEVGGRMRVSMLIIALFTVVLCWIESAAAIAAPAAESTEELNAIAQEAYIYLYPLVTMDVSRRQFTNIESGKMPGRGPMNTFSNIRAFPDANFREVVRPNFDTLYSSGWLDLTGGPVMVSAPDTGGRYYMLPMLDMWTDVFAVPGKRTTGTTAAEFAVVPPKWQGELPVDLVRIDAPTPYVWVIGRTQTNGPKDYEAIHKVQDGFKITPLSDSGKLAGRAAFKPDAAVDMKTPPLIQVNTMPAEKYFPYAAELMKVNPPHITDQPVIARMKRLGIEAGKDFDFSKADPSVRQALEHGVGNGLKAMQEKVPTLARVVNGWQMNTDTMGVYGNYYLKRAIVAMVGLGANLPEDAVYPLSISDSEGMPLAGGNKYVIHFAKEELPPVDAFWSITMYDAEGFQTPNTINRFAIGDRDELKFNADGSLDIYIQHDAPGSEKQSNWLPAPASGELGVTMRLYAPRTEVLDGRWAPPPVMRLP